MDPPALATYCYHWYCRCLLPCFKNNQAYDRVWEARKIWGAIVNSSRAWGSYVKGFVSDQFNPGIGENELLATKTRLIHRHIAWLYALRSQLLVPAPWEHISQNGGVAKLAAKRRRQFGIGLFPDQITIDELGQFLPADEHQKLIDAQNTATQIIDRQSEELRQLRKMDIIDDFRHMELQKILYDFYIHQGKLERIKKFPLPRQYGSMSFILVSIFIFLLPFAVLPLFNPLGDFGFYSSIPLTIIVAWVFLIMELIGDYSENPFEGGGNDIPMLSLCRVIEIDLREMLGEDDLPQPIESVNGVLM